MTDLDPARIDPKCPSCKGTGRIGYHFDQDTTRIAKCWRCFPEDEMGQRWKKLWDEGVNIV